MTLKRDSDLGVVTLVDTDLGVVPLVDAVDDHVDEEERPLTLDTLEVLDVSGAVVASLFVLDRRREAVTQETFEAIPTCSTYNRV